MLARRQPRRQVSESRSDKERKQENRKQTYVDSMLDVSAVGSAAAFVVVVVVVVVVIADVVNSLWLQQSSSAFLSLF